MNSSLVEYTKLSPSNSGRRHHAVDRITPHCVVGQVSAESLGDWFEKESTQASSNYGIDKDGRVGMYVEEANRAWTTSSEANDTRAITIECASDIEAPNAFRPAVYARLIDLCVDICERYGKKKLIWIPDRGKALSYQQKEDEMLLTVHRWFSNTSCPGEWLMARMDDLATQVTARLSGSDTQTETTTTPKNDVACTDSPTCFIESIAPACIEAMQKHGVLASVSIAQAVLESGWGESELATKAHNLFGMKAVLSGVRWTGKTYVKRTWEYSLQYGDYQIDAEFRAYDSIGDSIEDHGQYLATAKNGNALRYAGIIGETDPAKVCDILVKGGYATSPTYKESLMNIINRYGLTKYDKQPTAIPSSPETPQPDSTGETLPFEVRVTRTGLNLRAGAGKAYESRGVIAPGTYTVTKTKSKKGRTWGKVKITGWICLDYTEKV